MYTSSLRCRMILGLTAGLEVVWSAHQPHLMDPVERIGVDCTIVQLHHGTSC
jgi:hypothetical protein